MHRRPIIGIPTQNLQSLGGIPAEFPPSWVMSQRYILTLTAAGAIAFGAFTSACGSAQGDGAPDAAAHPIVGSWTGPYGGVPPWNDADPKLFPAAFETALAEQRAEIDAIASDRSAPDFENTIGALERSGRTLDRVARLFAVLRQNISTPEIQELDREWQPKLSAATASIPSASVGGSACRLPTSPARGYRPRS